MKVEKNMQQESKPPFSSVFINVIVITICSISRSQIIDMYHLANFMYLHEFWIYFKTIIHAYLILLFTIIDDFMKKDQNKIELEDRTGYVAVVTGGARGIGSHVVKMLMQCNMHVIIGCRDVDKGLNFLNQIRKEGIIKGNATVYHLDTASLKSVQKFSQQVIENHTNVNILVNNAGIAGVPYEETEDGIETHLCVNYMGHFLLTLLLLPHMNKISSFSTSSARILNVTSVLHSLYPKINFMEWDNSFRNGYFYHKAYGRSKTCQIMSSKYLQKYLNSVNSSIDIFSVHPGLVNSDIIKCGALKTITPEVILNLLLKDEESGAIPIVYACICKELNKKGGLYIGNCQPDKYDQNIDNEEDQEKLYEISLKVVEKYIQRGNPILKIMKK